ncbi:unnamed protein product, partial [Polarella glacialis]
MGNRPKPADLADTPAKVNFLVRNTFIDGIPETPTSPLDFKRQAQSCPGTMLMNHATPLSGTYLGWPSPLRKLGKEVPSSPPPPNPKGRMSPGLDGATERPWNDDLVKSLVSSAAAAISPMASSATRRGSPGVVSAYSLGRLSAALDPVAMAFASAASAAEAEEATAPPAIQSPYEYGRTPDQRYCATPSPWRGYAELRSWSHSLAANLESSDSVPEAMFCEDPVAMLVASAAAAATSQRKATPSPPSRTPTSPMSPEMFCANNPPPGLQPDPAWRSPEAKKASAACGAGGALQLPPWRRLPRIVSSGASESAEEMKDGFEHFRKEVGPDVKDMANSFADLVSPDCSPSEGGQGTERQWWQPLEAHPLGRTPSESCSASGPDLGGIAEEPDSAAPAGPGKALSDFKLTFLKEEQGPRSL